MIMDLRIIYGLIASGSFLIIVIGSEDVVFDDSVGSGRPFDGIGGLSGGGATSKLLINYPELQRNQILDYLFKPNFGASLQILKVEIGGDAQSTDGTEASHMHNSWDENYERGYEWWLMKEAKKRNPNIKLYGLPWGFPGWLGQGTRSPFANVSITADYIVRWVNGAKQFHNLTIDFIGIWNEHGYSIPYIKMLRQLLNKRGFEQTRIIAADEKWEIAEDVQKDASLAADVYAIGCHYPGTKSTSMARTTGKKLWSSEDYSTFNDEVGGGCWARILNQNYVTGLMTSTISWNLIASYYKHLPYYRDGLMTAVEPWSGHYVVETPIWMSAHTTQFTNIGWKYLAHGYGVGKLSKGGSYVGLTTSSGNDLTIVIETMSHDHSLCIRPFLPKYTVEPQTVHIFLKGSFAQIPELNVWYSKFGYNGTVTTMFQRKESLKFKNGLGILKLGVDEVYTLTTLTTGQKGAQPQPPPSKPFPLPYSDNFEDYQVHQEPYDLAQQTGAYEVLCSNNNQFIRQMVLQTPILWCPADKVNKSLNLIGRHNWTDIYIEVEFSIPKVNGTSGVFVAARVDTGGCHSYFSHGIFFFILKDKYILANDLARTKEIKSGPLPGKLSGWHKLSLFVESDQAYGFLDGSKIVETAIPTKPPNGFAGLGTDSYGLADFDNIFIGLKKHALDRMGRQFKGKSSNPLYFSTELQ